MPEENNDLKNGAGSPAGEGQPAAKGTDGGSGDGAGAGSGAAADETVTISKVELEKIKTDRDNYRTGLLAKKADERNLDGGKPNGSGDGKHATASIDETKVTEIAKAQATAIVSDIHASNERRAKTAFFKKYGEYVDDAQWVQLMSHFTQKRGKSTSEDIFEDLEDAVLLHKRSTGKLEDHLKAERERGRMEGRTENYLDAGRSGAGTGDRNDSKPAGSFGTPQGEAMARSMHIDPEKAKKVDPTKDNVINVL